MFTTERDIWHQCSESSSVQLSISWSKDATRRDRGVHRLSYDCKSCFYTSECAVGFFCSGPNESFRARPAAGLALQSRAGRVLTPSERAPPAADAFPIANYRCGSSDANTEFTLGSASWMNFDADILLAAFHGPMGFFSRCVVESLLNLSRITTGILSFKEYDSDVM
ncbi:hypothetical protein EVAR_65057_1 [Eumeta japonica]|uniref:Uncharacterized protein n=1 Tax=Eumeta variegata TaxID=151549 RepID=A0A4C2A1S6_EUMVA|nr:hypothetical protein EVAR_65057_1 [Eumeta japonica]